MKKTFFLLILPLLSVMLLLLPGCEKGVDEPDRPSFITISATIVAEAADARIALSDSDEDGKMETKWNNNDELQLCFIYNDIPYKRTVRTTTVSDDGKKAIFRVELPQEFTSGSFDLYGVSGGAGLNDENPRLAEIYGINEDIEMEDLTLQQIKDKNIPVLKCEKKAITWSENISIDVDMNHLGWIAALHIKNNTEKELHLKPVMNLNSKEAWIYNRGKNSYDVVNNKFTIDPASDCQWILSATPLQNGKTRTYWQWVASTGEIPDLTLAIYDGIATEPFATSGNVLRKRAINNGNIYHFYAQFETDKDILFTRPFTDIMPADISNGGDPYFTMDDIVYWVGTGTNNAALVIEWHDGKYPDALVWGYRWDGEAKGSDMMNEIVKADPLLITAMADQWGGRVIGGIGYNIDKKPNHYLVVDNETDKPKYPENGFIEVNSTDFDNISYSNPLGHWQSGWYKGYWSYFVKDEWSDAWEYSNSVVSSRTLQDGSWDGWSFLDDMNEYSGRPLGNEFNPALPD